MSPFTARSIFKSFSFFLSCPLLPATHTLCTARSGREGAVTCGWTSWVQLPTLLQKSLPSCFGYSKTSRKSGSHHPLFLHKPYQAVRSVGLIPPPNLTPGTAILLITHTSRPIPVRDWRWESGSHFPHHVMEAQRRGFCLLEKQNVQILWEIKTQE